MTGRVSQAQTLQVAEDVSGLLRSMGAESVVIGAVALAIHGYPRATEDLDLAVAVSLAALGAVAEALRRKGYEVDLHEPDAQDPLGGVLNVRAPGADLVQIVNFDNPPANGFPQLVKDSIASSVPLAEDSSLRVVDPYHLVAFKLYAGGPKSKLDILELLERNPDMDHSRLAELCDTYRLSAEWNALLALMG